MRLDYRIREWWYHFREGISNVYRWTPVIWEDADWDYSYLLTIMEYKFRRMNGRFKQGFTKGSAKEARNLLICAVLCKRLAESVSDYYDRMIPTDHMPLSHLVTQVESIRRQDEEMLGRILSKHVRCWWD